MNGRFYWLKLRKDFFKRHDIKILEAMNNGKEIVMFYIKMLCESLDHEGHLRFSEELPYTTEMLSVVTNTDLDITIEALSRLTELCLIEVLEDGTYFMTEVDGMIGSAVDNDNANRQRRFRESQKQALRKITDGVTENNESKSKSKNKSKNKSKRESIFTPPTVEEVRAYCIERDNGINAEHFIDFYESKGWLIGKNKMKDWKACVRTWERRNKKADRLDWIDEV